jgi:hypothetical protein
MTFREKSAWAMGALMIATGLWYLFLALNIPAEAPALAQLGAVLPYVLVVIVGSIAIQVGLTVFNLRDAQRPADERERIVIDRAGHWSGVVLATGVVNGAILYLVTGQPNLLFHFVIGSMIVAQLAEYAFQITLFRRGA